jgi:lambda family phage tail tape measure protein
MANMIARLGVVLGLDSAEFVRGIESASRKLEQFEQAVGKYGAAAAAALTAASFAALRYADEMVDVAKANDVAVDSVVKLSNALALSGGKAEDVSKIFASFSNFVDKASDGSLEAQKSFAKIGVSLKDLGQLSSTELFDKTVRALAAIEDPITRNAKAMEMLGKAAKGVDIRELLTQMEEGKTLADEQAKALEKAAEVYDLITKSGRQFMLMLATELGTPLKATIDYFREMTGEVFSFGNGFKTVFQTVAVLAANTGFVIKQIVGDMVALGRVIVAFQTFNYKDVPKILSEAMDRAQSDRARLDQFERTVMGTGDLRRGLDDPRIVGRSGAVGRAVTPAKDPEAEKRAREAERLREKMEKYVLQKQQDALKVQEQINVEAIQYSDQLQKNGLALYDMQKAEMQRLGLEKQLLEIEMNRGKLLPEQVQYQKDMAMLYKEHQNNLQKIYNAEISREERERANRQETENYYRRLELAQQKLDQAMEKRRGSFEEGFMGKMQEFFRDVPTQMEIGAQAFDSVMGNMTRAIDNFTRTGKLSFKELTRSIIQDLIRIQLQSQMTSIFKTFIGSIFGGGIRGTGLNSVGATGGYNSLAAFADGGSIGQGQPALVGERGPELFVPRSAGTIVPNHVLGGGGTTNVTNNYIQAIDVQSFEQRLLGSSNTIWAANQYAQKSLATGRGRT